MPTTNDDRRAVEEFAASLGARDPKTIATYRSVLRHFITWLALQPGGTPFHLGLVTTAGTQATLAETGRNHRGAISGRLVSTVAYHSSSAPSRKCREKVPRETCLPVTVLVKPVRPLDRNCHRFPSARPMATTFGAQRRSRPISTTSSLLPRRAGKVARRGTAPATLRRCWRAILPAGSLVECSL